MKTIEEMMPSVIAEVERLCKDGKQDKLDWISFFMRDGIPMSTITIPGRYSVNKCIKDHNVHEIAILYTTLGLEARDAVEAAETQFETILREQLAASKSHYMEIIEAERAHAAKLLEAAKAVISESEKEYAVTTMSEVAMLSDGFEQAIANLDAVLSELEKGGAGE